MNIAPTPPRARGLIDDPKINARLAALEKSTQQLTWRVRVLCFCLLLALAGIGLRVISAAMTSAADAKYSERP